MLFYGSIDVCQENHELVIEIDVEPVSMLDASSSHTNVEQVGETNT